MFGDGINVIEASQGSKVEEPPEEKVEEIVEEEVVEEKEESPKAAQPDMTGVKLMKAPMKVMKRAVSPAQVEAEEAAVAASTPPKDTRTEEEKVADAEEAYARIRAQIMGGAAEEEGEAS